MCWTDGIPIVWANSSNGRASGQEARDAGGKGGGGSEGGDRSVDSGGRRALIIYEGGFVRSSWLDVRGPYTLIKKALGACKLCFFAVCSRNLCPEFVDCVCKAVYANANMTAKHRLCLSYVTSSYVICHTIL